LEIGEGGPATGYRSPLKTATERHCLEVQDAASRIDAEVDNVVELEVGTFAAVAICAGCGIQWRRPRRETGRRRITRGFEQPDVASLQHLLILIVVIVAIVVASYGEPPVRCLIDYELRVTNSIAFYIG
jgi:hypothetical protein